MKAGCVAHSFLPVFVLSPGLLVFQHGGKREDPGDKVAISLLLFFSTEPEF